MFASSGVAPQCPPHHLILWQLPCYKEGQRNLKISYVSDLAVVLLGFLQCTANALTSFSDISFL